MSDFAMYRILPAFNRDPLFFGNDLLVDLSRTAGTVFSPDDGHLVVGYYSPLGRLLWGECAVRIYLIVLAHTSHWEELVE